MMSKKKYDRMINMISSIMVVLIIMMLSVFVFNEPISFIHYVIVWLIVIRSNK